MKYLALLAFVVVVGAGTYFITPRSVQPVACTMEAKMCPDGSSVGRTGPQCEFAECPSSQTSTTTPSGDTTLAIGQKATIDGLDITLNSLVGDSRCPVDVQCIQAGWVTVNVTISHGQQSETKDLSSHSPITFGGYQLSIVNVVPARESKTQISEKEYRITMHGTLKRDPAAVPVPL